MSFFELLATIFGSWQWGLFSVVLVVACLVTVIEQQRRIRQYQEWLRQMSETLRHNLVPILSDRIDGPNQG